MDQKRIDTVQKLLRKAERAGTQEEAESYYAKAQDLMTKWSIDDLMLAASGEEKNKDEIVQEPISMSRSGYLKSYQRLATEVAEANGIKVLWRTAQWKDLAGVLLVGWKSDVERVQMLYASLLIQMSRERRRQLPAEYRFAKQKDIARWRISFGFGYAFAIGRRLRDQADRTKKEAVDADYSGSLLPAVIDRDAKLEEFFNSMATRKIKSRGSILDEDGILSGRAAAERADIGNTRMGGARKSVS